MDNAFSYTLLALALAYVWRWLRDPLRAIPTVGGPSAPLFSFLGAVRFWKRAQDVVQQGYDRYQGSAFKVAMFDQWLVVLSGPEMVEQVRKLSDDVASSPDGVLYLTQVDKYTPAEVLANPYHVEVVRDKLTRGLTTVMPVVMDELQVVCEELFPAKDGKSVSLPCSKAMLDIVARVISRTFVGVPTCRDPAYLKAAATFTVDLIKARTIINMFPEMFKGIVSRLITAPKDNVNRVLAMLEPVMKERIEMLGRQEKGDASLSDTPNDMLQWLIDQTLEHKDSLVNVPTRLHLMNFAAMHTTSLTLTHAFYHLLANPDIIPQIREEAKQAVSAEGWTRAALDKMHKLDSLIKESHRLSSINILGMVRRALKDITLSDGTYIPAGTLFGFAAQSLHTDAHHYPDPEHFEAFRFSDARGDAGTDESASAARNRFVNTSSEYIPFGRGKHACPGRFFAALELKTILAYLVVNYDMELEGGAVRPPNIRFSFTILPSQTAVAVFRKRKDAA